MTEVEKMQARLALKTELDFSYQDLEGDMMPGADTWQQFPNLTHVNLSHTLGCTAGMLARLARGTPKLSKLNLNNEEIGRLLTNIINCNKNLIRLGGITILNCCHQAMSSKM